MGQKMYNVTIQGITKQYPEKIPYSEIVKEYEGSTDAPVMLVIVNGRLRELHKHLKADCEIEFVTSKDPIGHKTYCRSASLILLKAIYDVAGQENIDSVVIHYSVGSGYYFTMKGPMALDQEFIDKVKAQMHRIVDENLPIVKRSVSTSEAVALFHKHHMYDKEKLFNYRRSSAVNLYSIEVLRIISTVLWRTIRDILRRLICFCMRVVSYCSFRLRMNRTGYLNLNRGRRFFVCRRNLRNGEINWILRQLVI